MNADGSPSRREVLGAAALWLASTAAGPQPTPEARPAAPIIDIHQHTRYSGRTDEQLLHHQLMMGATTTILLPAGTPVNRPSTHDGKTNGLAAGCGGNDTVVALAKQHPGSYRFFANEVPDLPTTRDELTKYLKAGGLGIGEQKFNVPCDGKEIATVAEVAQDFGVPVLMHFQEGMFNSGFENFHKTLSKFPKVNFIGHAQTVWAYIDKNYRNPKDLYPKGKVTPGGLTDRYLSDYPNFWADISAGSGLNAILRDEEQMRGFLQRHADRVLFGSDCNDAVGRGPTCQGWLTITAIRRVAPDHATERKILYENAMKLFRL